METKIEKAEDIAARAILFARNELIMTHRFYGALVTNVTPVITRKVARAATDGLRHFWNPDYVASIDTKLMLFTQAHESEHDARKHHLRRFGRDAEKWNVACDYAINIDLKDTGFAVPDWAYCDAKYRGMSAEDIYRARELDEAKQQQQQQPDDQDDDQSDADQGEGQDGDADQDGDEQSQEAAEDGQGDAGEEPGEGSDGSGGVQDPSYQEPSQGAGEGSGEGEAEGDAQEGAGSGEPSSDDAGEPQPGPGGSGGDPRSCGDVLDTPGDPSDLVEEEMKWERTVRQAVSMAKAAGQLPGHITREIERSNTQKTDWRDELREFFDQGAIKRESWSRLNRRLIGSGLYMPGTKRDGLNKVVFMIDTSGSMDEVALQCINTEAQAALDEGVIDEVVVVYGDTKVTRVDEYHSGDQIEFDPRGGGGTNMTPLFKHVEEQIDSPSMIISFTDLYWYGDLPPEPSVPVLFAVTGYPDQVRKLISDAPWGARGIDVGAH